MFQQLQNGCCVGVACVHAQSYPMLCDPMDCSLPGSSVHGIFQARILEWVAIPFSRGLSQSRGQTCVSCIGRWILYHSTWEAPNTTLLSISIRALGWLHGLSVSSHILKRKFFFFFSWTVGLNSWLKIFSKPQCKQICSHPSISVPFT